jgi:hypothetical protein
MEEAAAYKIAIPSYNRVHEITHKTLLTLRDARIDKNKIHIFVANNKQRVLYSANVPAELYGKIIVGKKGITRQRNFIARYFPAGTYIISLDDDIEQFETLTSTGTLTPHKDLHGFFTNAYHKLLENNLFIWGIYPVHNPFFMYNKITTDLRFLIGVAFGFIARNNPVLMSTHAESKEDYEQTLLYYIRDGGVLRFNNTTVKTKFHAPGGLGTDRAEKNRRAADYLISRYGKYFFRKDRKNGMPEVQFRKRMDNKTHKTPTRRNITHKRKK